MSKPFDATLKDLAVINPVQFLTELDGQPSLPVRLLNIDLSTVTTATDLAFGLGDPVREVVHLDAQAGADADKHRDLLVYNALLHRQYRVPVHSILLLLRPKARHSDQTGSIAYSARPGRSRMDFGYEVIPLWERPAEALLASGLATLPLATLGRLPEGESIEDGMRRVVHEVFERLQREAAPGMIQRLLTAMWVLTGLRLDRKQARAIFQGIPAMRESDTYQAILDEGRVEGVQRTLLHLGRKKLGEPDETSRRAVMELTELEELDRLSERLLDVQTWQELLQKP
jgi:predicted transposase YdaD